MKRVIFYFDGFNFYNGLKEKSSIESIWKNYYWLDFIKFCDSFLDLSAHELIAVKYFTAPPTNPEKRSRQSALLNANKLINGDKFLVINGIYQNKTIKCGARCKENFQHPEEKRTDVSISTHMLIDCFKNIADIQILISADSDQIPTLDAISTNFPSVKTKVYFPPERSSADILRKYSPIVYLGNNENKFLKSIMPNIVSNEIKTYTKPISWVGNKKDLPKASVY